MKLLDVYILYDRGDITDGETATALGRTPRQTNMLMKTFNTVRPLKEYLLIRKSLEEEALDRLLVKKSTKKRAE